MSHSVTNFQSLLDSHPRELEGWTLGEIFAVNIILNRLDSSMCLRTHEHMTAKQLYCTIADIRKETATAPYALALKTFLRTKFVSHADEYINKFQANLQSFNEAADTLHAITRKEFHVSKGQAASIFFWGTKNDPWLSNWRDLRACSDENSCTLLEIMMSTIRVVDGHRRSQIDHVHNNNFAFVAHSSAGGDRPIDEYKRCRYRHKNRECLKEHPELAVGPTIERWHSVGNNSLGNLFSSQ